MSSLSDKTMKGLLWTSLSQGASLVLVLSYNIIMARLLTPQDFGLFGMAVVFTGFMGALFSLGLGVAIIQRQDIGDETYGAVFWVNLALGLCVGAAVFAAAPYVAEYFGEGRLRPMLRFMAVNAPLGSLASVPVGLLSKGMKFREQAAATLLASAIAFTAAVLFAAGGWGYWSIVFGNTLQIALSSLLTWRAAAWRPPLAFSLAALRPVIGFGIFKSLTNMGVYLTRSIDLFLVGKILGAVPLGLYTVAITLAKAPSQKVRNIVGLVAFPAFARIQGERERIERNVYRACRAASLVLMPFFAVLFLLAGETVEILYGAKWAASIPVLRILLFYTVFRSLAVILQTVLMSTGRAGTVFAVFLAETALLAVLILAGISRGLSAVAVAVCAGTAAGLLMRLEVLKRVAGLRGGELVRSIAPPVSAHGALLAVLAAAKAAAAPVIDSVVSLTLYAGGAAVLHLGVNWLVMNGRERADVTGLFRGRASSPPEGGDHAG